MSKRTFGVAARPRERLIDAAYELFSSNGVNKVGIDTVLAKSGCAKASLYSNFNSKVDLAIAFLDRRETVWTRQWLESEIKSRAVDPKARLLAIFDVFDGWFQKSPLKAVPSSMSCWRQKRTAQSTRQPRFTWRRSAPSSENWQLEANLRDADKFAQVWHMLMKGSIISAGEGNREAACEAKYAARLVLDGWKRKSHSGQPKGKNRQPGTRRRTRV